MQTRLRAARHFNDRDASLETLRNIECGRQIARIRNAQKTVFGLGVAAFAR